MPVDKHKAVNFDQRSCESVVIHFLGRRSDKIRNQPQARLARRAAVARQKNSATYKLLKRFGAKRQNKEASLFQGWPFNFAKQVISLER